MRRKALSLAATFSALVLVLAGCGGSGATGDGTTLRLALNQSEDHPSFVALDNFSERLSERTNGRVNIDVYPNENLGAQQDSLNLVSDGSIDLAIVSGTQLESLNEDFIVFNLPYVFDSIEHQMRVINDEAVVGELYSSLEDQDLTVLGGFTQGPRHLYTAGREVTEPVDLAGMKIRVQESEVHSRMVELMGGSPTPMSYGEVYTALQAGVLDGAENNEVSYLTKKHHEVAPHFSTTNHLVGLDYLVMNTDRLARMSPADRAAFDEEWNAAMQEHTDLWTSATKEAIAELKAEGAKFRQVDEAAFRKALEPLTQEYLTTDTARELYAQTRAVAR